MTLGSGLGAVQPGKKEGSEQSQDRSEPGEKNSDHPLWLVGVQCTLKSYRFCYRRRWKRGSTTFVAG